MKQKLIEAALDELENEEPVTWALELDLDVAGSHLVGTINCDYTKLESLLGKPIERGALTQDARVEWVVHFSDMSWVTIYDYGQNNVPVRQVKEWNLGSKSSFSWAAREHLDDLLAGKLKHE